MPLPDAYLGSGLAWPLKFSTPSQTGIPTTNNSYLTFTPSMIFKVTYGAVLAKDADGLSVSHLGAATAGTTSQTLGGALTSGGVGTFATPRNVVITVTHASSVVAMSGTITGTDQYGKTITEAWSVTATGTSKTFTGKKAFKTVTSITETVAADASANSIVSGNGDVLGLPFKTAQITATKELEDGATPTPGVLVAGSSASTADYRGTYAPNSAPNGTKVFVLWFLVDDPTDIGT